MKVGGLSAVGRGTGASDHPDDHTDIEQLFEVIHMDLLSFYYTPDHRMGRRNAGLRGHISATGYYGGFMPSMKIGQSATMRNAGWRGTGSSNECKKVFSPLLETKAPPPPED